MSNIFSKMLLSEKFSQNIHSFLGKFGISFFVTFSDISWLSCDWPVVNGGGNWSTRHKPPPNHKSLATFSQSFLGDYKLEKLIN